MSIASQRVPECAPLGEEWATWVLADCLYLEYNGQEYWESVENYATGEHCVQVHLLS